METLLEPKYVQFLLYGIGFALVVLVLFIVATVLKKTAASRVRSITTPFGMSQGELDKLKKEGGLTDEEMKKVRQSMARQMLERYKEDENKRKIDGGAEVALASFEHRLQTEGLAKVKEEEFADPVPSKPQTATPQPIANANVMPPLVPAAAKPALPESLSMLKDKSDVELEALVAAGFLSPEEMQLVRSAGRS